MRVLVIEDDKDFAGVLQEFLKDIGYEVSVAYTGGEALRNLETNNYDIVLLDLLLPDINGMEILDRIKENGKLTEVIVITGHGSIKTAVEAIKKGAYDFLTKPCSLSELEVSVKKASETLNLKRENELYKKERSVVHKYKGYVFESPAMKEILRMVKEISCADCPVLITGETGTGKEVLARIIHETSNRKDKPFIAINLAAIPKELVESELFGYEKGAFTGASQTKEGFFELAHGGTIFLDEIGEIDEFIQVKLLRVLETGKFYRVGGRKEIQSDVRIIAATNKDLKKLIREGKFREDLYYRLNIVEIKIPPLRERKEDILPLAYHYLNLFSRKYSKNIKGFTKEAEEILLNYSWQGNIRELKNVVERLVLFGKGEYITEEDLSCLTEAKDNYESGKLKEIEKEAIEEALKKFNYNKKKAAEYLGIPLRTFYRKLKKYNLM